MFGVFIAGVAVFLTSWRMYAHVDAKNSREHAELVNGLTDVKAELAAVNAKLDILLADRKT